MSSREFAAVIKPEPLLRRVTLLAGCAALLIGAVLLGHLPIAPWIRLVLVMLWLPASVCEIAALSRAMAGVSGIRLRPDGTTVVDRRGRETPARIMSGSIVLRRFAWLRLRLSSGRVSGELLRRESVTAEQWRHLQILWRHAPESFGGTVEAATISTRKTGSHFYTKCP